MHMWLHILLRRWLCLCTKYTQAILEDLRFAKANAKPKPYQIETSRWGCVIFSATGTCMVSARLCAIASRVVTRPRPGLACRIVIEVQVSAQQTANSMTLDSDLPIRSGRGCAHVHISVDWFFGSMPQKITPGIRIFCRVGRALGSPTPGISQRLTDACMDGYVALQPGAHAACPGPGAGAAGAAVSCALNRHLGCGDLGS